MIRTLLLLAVLSAPTLLCADPAPPAARFHAANAAHDQGKYAQAITAYTALIAEGHGGPEVEYNLGNALFRDGRAGEAVLHYRRAWSQAPRDADILANLRLAQQRTGALAPRPTTLQRIAFEFSATEWILALRLAYAAALLAAAIALFAPAVRRPALRLAATAALIGLIAATGWATWYTWSRSGEAVVTAPRQTALYEPRPQATPFFTTPEGSIVHIEDTFDNWVKIRADNRTAWLPRPAVHPVTQP
jgi:hypothetical protein